MKASHKITICNSTRTQLKFTLITYCHLKLPEVTKDIVDKLRNKNSTLTGKMDQTVVAEYICVQNCTHPHTV